MGILSTGILQFIILSLRKGPQKKRIRSAIEKDGQKLNLKGYKFIYLNLKLLEEKFEANACRVDVLLETTE